ncbi:hypothetical protein ACFL2R_02745 [Patescibacteria group bacterium]
MNNAISLVKGDMERHKVKVVLPDEGVERVLFLVMTSAKTSKLKDFRQTYGKRVTSTHNKIAEKIFGEGETDNIYGIFFDMDLKMIYAFNRDFADYDSEKKAVVFEDVDDLLLGKIEVKPDEEVKPNPDIKPPGGHFPFPGGGGGIGIRYSLTEKK